MFLPKQFYIYIYIYYSVRRRCAGRGGGEEEDEKSYKVKPVCIERTSPLLGSDVDSSGEAFGIYIRGQLDF